MDKFYFLILLFFIVKGASAQYVSNDTPTCSELVSYAKKNYDSKDSPIILSSSMLVKVERYKIDDASLVIAYIKKSNYDIYGSPYIFCGISDRNWTAFKNGGLYGSWGEAFHKYIMDYTCDCD